MDVHHINAFIADVDELFNAAAAGIRLERQKPFLLKQPLQTNDIVVIIGVNGDVRGQVLFSFDSNFGLHLAGRMCGGMVFTAIDDMVMSALGEMANMLSARAVSNIYNLTGKKANITPPTLLKPTSAIDIKVDAPIIGIPYYFQNQKAFQINFALSG